jgi:hypothetical protein
MFDSAKIAVFCQKHGIKKLSIFGSVAKGTFRPDSDVDVLIEFDPSIRIGLFGMTKLEMELTDIMGRKVDLVTTGGLKQLIKDTVLSEAEVLYAA